MNKVGEFYGYNLSQWSEMLDYYMDSGNKRPAPEVAQAFLVLKFWESNREALPAKDYRMGLNTAMWVVIVFDKVAEHYPPHLLPYVARMAVSKLFDAAK